MSKERYKPIPRMPHFTLLGPSLLPKTREVLPPNKFLHTRHVYLPARLGKKISMRTMLLALAAAIIQRTKWVIKHALKALAQREAFRSVSIKRDTVYLLATRSYDHVRKRRTLTSMHNPSHLAKTRVQKSCSWWILWLANSVR